MSLTNTLPLLILLSAFVPALLIFACKEQNSAWRRTLNLSSNLMCLVMIGLLIQGIYQGQTFETRLPLLPGMDLVLHADALSLLFVSLSGVLWLFTTIYAIGYLEGSKNRSRFLGFFCLCVTATLGIALAGNLITFLIFYELLTLTTYPLVVHKGDPKSLRAGRIYLGYTMVGGALLLVGVAWLKALAGPLDFTATGILSSMPHLDQSDLTIIFALLIMGLGVKAALFPLHGWLPTAMAAPAPVSALLHAVAVVKAGAFGIIRVVYDVYGIEFARDLGLTVFLAAIAAFTIIYGSILALRQNDLKRRLAYSTVSQVSYIALGAAIAGPIATIGGLAHLFHQGVMKITLFFCAGNLAETVKVHKVNEMNGVGRRMPLTMAAFTLAALGMIGVPPIAGFVSKWYLASGAIEVEAYWVLVVLAASSLLNAMYLLPILHAAWFKPSDTSWPKPQHKLEAHWMLVLPPVATAVMAVAAGVFASSAMSPLGWVELIAAREYGRDLIQQVVSVAASSGGATSLLWVVLTPLLFALIVQLPSLRRFTAYLVALAALPALLVAITSEPGVQPLDSLFFSGSLVLNTLSQVILLLAALLWLLVGTFSTDYLRKDLHTRRYYLCILLCMSGSFGLILAEELFTFISFFALMSFSAYGLILHSGTPAAMPAGKSYIRWVVLGELLLFSAMVGLAISTGSTTVQQMELSAQPMWVSGFLLVGFGIKAGLLGAHFWLPKAHPVAPVPASAVLSGLMVKAGLLGWWRFLPVGVSPLVDLGVIMITLGLGGALLGAVLGLIQYNPKTLLAYSTISQMGVMTAVMGGALVEPGLWPVLSLVLLFYVLHHGLAKAALFLGTGLTSGLGSSNKLERVTAWLVLVVPAIAMAGLPMTSGALAKWALKDTLTDMSVLTYLLPFTSVGTALLMLRFVTLVREAGARAQTSACVSWPQWLACLSLSLLILSLPLWTVFDPVVVDSWLTLAGMGSGVWPLLLALVLFGVVRKHMARWSEGVRQAHSTEALNDHRQEVKVNLPLAAALSRCRHRLLHIPRPGLSGNLQYALAFRAHPGVVFICVLVCLFLTLS